MFVLVICSWAVLLGVGCDWWVVFYLMAVLRLGGLACYDLWFHLSIALVRSMTVGMGLLRVRVAGIAFWLLYVFCMCLWWLFL